MNDKKNTKGEYLYLSYLIPESEFQKIKTIDASPQLPTHKFNWKIFKGIYNSEFFKDEFHLISTRPITDFPHSNIKYIKAKIWNSEYGIIHENWFSNYPVIKQFTIFLSSISKGLKWAITTPKDKRKCVIVYSVTFPYLISGFLIAKFCKIPLIGIWTDPPVVPTPWDSTWKKKLRGLQKSFSKFFMKRFNGVVSLTRFLSMDFNPLGEHLLIEAISDSTQINEKPLLHKKEKFVILYSGSLLKKYGILEFIKAFNELDYIDMELWIFGKGDIEDEINNRTLKDKRIKYFGFVDNSKVMELQKEASLLINPRPINLLNGKYSFPSKILEYLESGTPALVTKLSGIPDEYNNYLFFFDNDDATSMRNKVEEIYLMDRERLWEFGYRAFEFSKTKTIKIQGDKIASFINNVCNNYH